MYMLDWQHVATLDSYGMHMLKEQADDLSFMLKEQYDQFQLRFFHKIGLED